MSPWKDIDVSVMDNPDVWLQVLMGRRTQRLFSGVESEGTEFKEGIKKGDAESFVVEPRGTATLFRHTISEEQKSLSTKCLLLKKYLQTIFAESILHA
jgi:hypothetical protein